jgi:CO/xanthine dehydrogenase Mo-binding subunit
MFANWRGSVHATGPYRVKNVKTDYYGVYTNTIYSGAYRGFSAPQTVFASESIIDELAYKLDISPKEIRLKNCLRPGDTFATGQKFGPGEIPAPLEKIIEETCKKADYDRKRDEYTEFNKNHEEIKKGIGLSCTIRGAGLGGEGIDTAGATLTIEQDGSINMISDLTEMGQGMRTAHAQIAAETMGVTLDKFTFVNTDTSMIMDGGPTVASRGTLAGGQAVLTAAQKLKTRLKKAATQKFECNLEDIKIEKNIIFNSRNEAQNIEFEELVSYCLNDLGLSLSAQGWYNPGPEELDEETGQGKAYPTYVYGCAVTEITVDVKTGKVNVDKITAGYDIGTPINPQQVKGQLYGGLMQGLGYSIMEEFSEKEGYLKTTNFDDYLIPSFKDLPEIDIKLFDIEDTFGPYGAKSVGELGIELVAPSVTNAYYDATQNRVREIPLNLERTLLGKSLSK